MSTRAKILVAIALLFAALFVRLGFWQLERLRERREYNAPVEARLHEPAIELRSLPRDPEQARHRRVVVSGEYDYAREIVLTLRSRQGSPGVNLLTPLRIPGTDTAVLVNRGWIYAPDGVSADTKPWREPSPARAVGYVRLLETGGADDARAARRPDAVRRPHLPTISRMLPYPVARYYVVLTSAPTGDSTAPPRVPPPAISEGSHLSYAVQWFTFALIAVGGVVILVLRLRSRDAERESKSGVWR